MGRLFMLCNHLYGKCFSVKVLDRLIYVVNDPEMLKVIFLFFHSQTFFLISQLKNMIIIILACYYKQFSKL